MVDFCVRICYTIITVREINLTSKTASVRKEQYMEEMTRLELLTLLLSVQALLESDNVEKAKEVIAEVIAEARKN